MFQAFRHWLGRIYRSAAGLDVTISPAVREVMDRMLATEEEIREAEIAAGQNEAAATEADVAPEVWVRLQELKAEAREAAFVTLMKRQMEELKAEHRTFLAEEERKARMAIETQILDEPLYGAELDMSRDIGGDPRILANAYRAGELGVDIAGTIDGIAEGHGSGSGDELAQDVLNNLGLAEEIQFRVAQDMEQHAGLLLRD